GFTTLAAFTAVMAGFTTLATFAAVMAGFATLAAFTAVMAGFTTLATFAAVMAVFATFSAFIAMVGVCQHRLVGALGERRRSIGLRPAGGAGPQQDGGTNADPELGSSRVRHGRFLLML
ncbi:hypothetical protein, partial [Halomonas sp. ND22Bw]|uniref:hypothetical protein n=1 Tax=Halomonas sp. ND22Bw TaxID=2054178 RepID=UPI001C62501F